MLLDVRKSGRGRGCEGVCWACGAGVGYHGVEVGCKRGYLGDGGG